MQEISKQGFALFLQWRCAFEDDGGFGQKPSCRNLTYRRTGRDSLAGLILLCICGKQSGKLSHRGKLLETMLRRNRYPRQFLARVGFDEWNKPGVIIEHRRSNVDELITRGSGRPREYPRLAMRAEEMTSFPVQSANHRLALGYLDRTARKHSSQRVGTGAHALTARAVAGHGHDRCGRCANPQLPASASTVPRKRQAY
jgi:hypothetical protein